MTSDNVSPHHLMDIKRVAFETRPVGAAEGIKPSTIDRTVSVPKPAVAATTKSVDRNDIASIVDKFLTRKLAEDSKNSERKSIADAEQPKTVIHDVSNSPNGGVGDTVDFVSEDDVRDAIAKGKKIYISKGTIITPSARDLGEENEIFAKI